MARAAGCRLSIAALVFAIMTVIVARPAHAILWMSSDLDSLVLESTAIVLADEVASGTSGRSTVRTYRVVKAYRGSLLPGRTIEVVDSYPRTSARLPGATFDPIAILFLAEGDGKSLLPASRGDEGSLQFRILHSGLRLLREGRVFTFDQGVLTSGPISPVPERRWRASGLQDQAITLREFELEVASAVVRIETFEALKSVQDPVARRTRLLSILDAYASEAERYRRAHAHSFEVLESPNLFLAAFVDRFLSADDLAGALEVAHRTGRRGLVYRRAGANRILAFAADREQPARLRVAAIEVVDQDEFRVPRVFARVAELAGDPEGQVGAAAAAKLRWLYEGYTRNSRQWSPELTDAWDRARERARELAKLRK